MSGLNPSAPFTLLSLPLALRLFAPASTSSSAAVPIHPGPGAAETFVDVVSVVIVVATDVAAVVAVVGAVVTVVWHQWSWCSLISLRKTTEIRGVFTIQRKTKGSKQRCIMHT